ncbi:AMP phosphorylase [Bienertia sinuspersici]
MVVMSMVVSLGRRFGVCQVGSPIARNTGVVTPLLPFLAYFLFAFLLP